MIKEAIGVASTIEEARKIALQNLNAPLEADVTVEIVTMPKKKLLGLFGGADAQVKAFYDDGKKEAKKETHKTPADKKPQQDKKKTDKKPQVKKETPKKEFSKKEAPAKETPKKEIPKKEVSKKPEVAEIDLSAIESKETPATDYLKSILEGMGFTGVKVLAKETDEDVYFDITCEEDYGNIIGRRGETLDALQYLTRLFVNRANNNNKRVSLNVGDYRVRREETLRGLAKRQASKVLKYKRSTALEPMNPYERRIIHTTIQEVEGVTSHSVGEGDRRRVVITLEGGEARRGNFRNDRRPREKRAPYVPEISADREKKVDVKTSSLYGKIEPKKKAEENADE